MLLCHTLTVLHIPATSVSYTLSLHDALPISGPHRSRRAVLCAVRPGDAPVPRLDDASNLRATSVRGVVQSWDWRDRKSTRLNSSHTVISYAVFFLIKKK